MLTTNFNSMPQNVSDGINDQSVPPPILQTAQYPTHLPLCYIFAQKGPLTRTVADGPTREQLYGSASFDNTKKWFTHTTQFSTSINDQGNQCVYQRVVDPAASQAMMRWWADVLPTNIPEYKRDSNGNYLLDQSGNPQPTGTTVPGFQVKFVKTPIDATHGGAFGQAAQMNGDQVDATSGKQSTRYPLVDFPVMFIGSYGDDMGFRAWAPVAGSRVLPDAELIETNKAYPYIMSCQDGTTDSIRNILTESGSAEITCVFKRNQSKASVSQDVSFETRFYDAYNDQNRTGLPPLYGPFDKVFLYYSNLNTILAQFYDAEKSFIDIYSDFDGSGYTKDVNGVITDEGEIHRFNFIGGRSSKNVPYHSYVINRADANAEPFSDISTIWPEGGSDGDTSLNMLDTLVTAEVTKFGDIEEEVTFDRLGNPMSFLWDSGFGVDTKMAMVNFIAVRKDTFLVWCLQDAQQARPLTADEESSLAIALYTRGQMMPESSTFATPACRFMIVAGDGVQISSTNRNRLPLALEIASKTAAYAGAANGVWKSSNNFSHGKKAELTMFRNVNVTFRPFSARQRDWANGMIYVQKKDMQTLFFPALRTGYSVDQSILQSYFTVMCFVDLQKVADRVWSQFSGASEYTNEQFAKNVTQEFLSQIQGKYDSRVTIVPTVQFTAVDEYNGYSWTLNVAVGADNMKTVQYTILTGYRQESMPSTNSQ